MNSDSSVLEEWILDVPVQTDSDQGVALISDKAAIGRPKPVRDCAGTVTPKDIRASVAVEIADRGDLLVRADVGE